MRKGRLNGVTKKEEKKQGKLRNGEGFGDVKLNGSEKEREKSGNKSVNVCCSLRLS